MVMDGLVVPLGTPQAEFELIEGKAMKYYYM